MSPGANLSTPSAPCKKLSPADYFVNITYFEGEVIKLWFSSSDIHDKQIMVITVSGRTQEDTPFFVSVCSTKTQAVSVECLNNPKIGYPKHNMADGLWCGTFIKGCWLVYTEIVPWDVEE